jgi:hypothetical protein
MVLDFVGGRWSQDGDPPNNRLDQPQPMRYNTTMDEYYYTDYPEFYGYEDGSDSVHYADEQVFEEADDSD